MRDRDIFGLCPDSEFFGRLREIDYISRTAADADKSRPGFYLTGKRWIGKTEVLRRVHRNLFWGQGSVAPVYYRLRGAESPAEFAEDFLREVVKQYVAFRRREPQMIGLTVPLERLQSLLIDNDMEDLASVVSRHIEARNSGDVQALVKNAVLSPSSLSLSSGTPVFLILDDMDLLPGIKGPSGPSSVAGELSGAFSSPRFSFLCSSSGRSFNAASASLPGYTERMELAGLSEDESASMMMELCRLWGVDFDTEAATLLARKCEGNPMYIKSMVWAARREGLSIAGFREISALYSSEVTSGNISHTLSSSIRLAGLNGLKVLSLLSLSSEAGLERIGERFRLNATELEGIIESLASTGLVRRELGSMKWAGDRVTADFVRFMHETAVKGRSRDEARTALVREVLKEDFGTRGDRVRGNLREEAAEVLKSFNGQKVLKALLHNRTFLSRLKDGAYMPDTQKGEEEVALPASAGCYDSQTIEKGETGPPILLAHAFQNSRFDSGSEVVWAASVKDAATPVNAGDVENFLRRTSILKENIRAPYLVRWMISREGFTEEAISRCDSEGVWSSDYAQFSMIRERTAEKGLTPKAESLKGGGITPSKEFEVVIPSSSKAELVAAKAVEEIGVEMGFDENSIGRIKAAVVEACINAFEHGRTKASRVRLRFVASSDRLSIHVENPGIDFEGHYVREAPGSSGPGGAEGGAGERAAPRKRGWGLELMKGLMDEVRFEKLRGGTRLVLVKYLLKRGEAGDAKED